MKKELMKIYGQIRALFVPTVSLKCVIKNNGIWIENDCRVDDYVYYWIGDFKTGNRVKVKSIEVVRNELKKAEATLNIVTRNNNEIIETLNRR